MIFDVTNLERCSLTQGRKPAVNVGGQNRREAPKIFFAAPILFSGDVATKCFVNEP